MEETRKIRLTEDELRIFAKLIAGELSKESALKVDKKIIDLAQDKVVAMSTGLANVLINAFPGHTLRQLAEAKWVTFGRVKGIGKARYYELVRIFEAFGLTEGDKKIKWDYKNTRYIIE